MSIKEATPNSYLLLMAAPIGSETLVLKLVGMPPAGYAQRAAVLGADPVVMHPPAKNLPNGEIVD